MTGTPGGVGHMAPGDHFYGTLKEGKTVLAELFLKIEQEYK